MDEDMAIEIHPSVLLGCFYPIFSMQNLYKNERKYREGENETWTNQMQLNKAINLYLNKNSFVDKKDLIGVNMLTDGFN
jgi:hypothetical protein